MSIYNDYYHPGKQGINRRVNCKVIPKVIDEEGFELCCLHAGLCRENKCVYEVQALLACPGCEVLKVCERLICGDYLCDSCIKAQLVQNKGRITLSRCLICYEVVIPIGPRGIKLDMVYDNFRRDNGFPIVYGPQVKYAEYKYLDE